MQPYSTTSSKRTKTRGRPGLVLLAGGTWNLPVNDQLCERSRTGNGPRCLAVPAAVSLAVGRSRHGVGVGVGCPHRAISARGDQRRRCRWRALRRRGARRHGRRHRRYRRHHRGRPLTRSRRVSPAAPPPWHNASRHPRTPRSRPCRRRPRRSCRTSPEVSMTWLPGSTWRRKAAACFLRRFCGRITRRRASRTATTRTMARASFGERTAGDCSSPT